MMAPRSAYLHIPFCRRRCYYCDFPVTVVGDRLRGEASGTIVQYLQALEQEIRLTPATGQPLETVFLGGGTPSLLDPAQVSHLLQVLEGHFGLTADAEISLEIDPGTFDRAQLQGYRTAGVNRVSLGVQAFQAELLAACGRTHTVQDIDAAIDLIHQVDLPNFSLDLISGLPNQTMPQWQESLERAIAYQPAHLSCYDLILEPGTAFYRRAEQHRLPLPPDDLAAAMYRLAQQRLTAAGYEHYEISNYSRSGYFCRHNLVYWENRSYYGFGMGAASYVMGDRVTRPRKTREYFQWLEEQRLRVNSAGECPREQSRERSPELVEILMLGLRLRRGVALTPLMQQWGEPVLRRILRQLQKYGDRDLVTITWEPAQAGVGGSLEQSLDRLASLPPTAQAYLRLSDPEGFLLSNTILAEIFALLEV